MSNVIPFPGLEHFQPEPWIFFIEERGENGGRIQTYLEDPRVITATTLSGNHNRCFDAEIVRVEGD